MALINHKILVSDAKNFSNDKPINPYYHHESINIDKAIQEHENLKDILLKSGVEVINVQSPPNCQDGVYTANWALVRGNKAVLARLPNARQAEEDYAEKALNNLGKEVIKLPAGLKFSGQGDALACGDLLFCGKGYRSDEEAQKIAAEILGYKRIQLQTKPKRNIIGKPIINSSSGWPDSFFYDLDLALAIIQAPASNVSKGLIAYCPEAFTAKSRKFLENFNDVDKIKVSISEAKKGFATNLISTGKTVIMSAHAPNLAKELRERGLDVISPNISELAKGGGYIRCMTLTIV